MRGMANFFAGLGALLLASACASHATTADLAIEHVAVIDVTSGSVLPNQTVLIAGDRIVAVGSSAFVHATNAQTIDGAGEYLIPGLWDAHVHSASSLEWHFPLYVAHGVTSVRNMHTSLPAPLNTVNDIKRRLADGELLGPRFYANGALVDGEPSYQDGSAIVTTPEEGRAFVDAMAVGGADFIKVYDQLSRESYFAILDEARVRGVPVYGHIPFRIRPEEAANAGQLTDEHGFGMAMGCSTTWEAVRDDYEETIEREGEVSRNAPFQWERNLYDTRDPAACAGAIEAYRRNGVAVTPTLAIYYNNNDWKHVLGDPEQMRLVPDEEREFWAFVHGPAGDERHAMMEPVGPLLAANVRLFHEAGVVILAGTDVGNPTLVPGVSLHQELGYLVDEAGLSPLEALRTATVNPARRFGLDDDLGTIREGKLADLVLLNANPLEDIANAQQIDAVVLGGRYMSRADLDALLLSAQVAPE